MHRLCACRCVSYHTDLPKYLHYYNLGAFEGLVWQALKVRHQQAAINLCTSAAMVGKTDGPWNCPRRSLAARDRYRNLPSIAGLPPNAGPSQRRASRFAAAFVCGKTIAGEKHRRTAKLSECGSRMPVGDCGRRTAQGEAGEALQWHPNIFCRLFGRREIGVGLRLSRSLCASLANRDPWPGDSGGHGGGLSRDRGSSRRSSGDYRRWSNRPSLQRHCGGCTSRAVSVARPGGSGTHPVSRSAGSGEMGLGGGDQSIAWFLCAGVAGKGKGIDE